MTKKNVVLGVTGSIAAYKACDIVSRLRKQGVDVHVILTRAGAEIITPLALETMSANPVVVDMFHRENPWEVEHISLAKRADVFLVAPATANFLGKAAHGIADDMLTTTILATRAPVLVAPAMNVNMYENPAVQPLVTYVDFETLLAQADVISLHMPLLDSNRHIIDRAAIARMKDGVVILNCSRGELADIEALVEGIESEKIGALGMDTCEGDEGIIHEDHRTDILPNRNWFYLHQFRNVIMTQHMAFYTDAAVTSMVRCGIRGIWEMAHGERCETELNK